MVAQQVQDPSPLAPRVSIGLPVYNGEEYLAEALEGLLAQTYTDFELIISDNASTDSTPEICARYARRDPRIRYVRQRSNVGAVPNHNALVPLARGELFKWVGADDVYAPELLERCVETLDAHPSAVLVNVWDGVIDEDGKVEALPYELETDHPEPWVRLRSLLAVDGGNDFYGLLRTDLLRSVAPLATYLHSDRTFMARLALEGPFTQVPQVLYYRRDHPGRASRGKRARAVVTTLDPRRASRLRHPLLRLYAEYAVGFVSAVFAAPLTLRERARCLGEVAAWLIRQMSYSTIRQVALGEAPAARPPRSLDRDRRRR